MMNTAMLARIRSILRRTGYKASRRRVAKEIVRRAIAEGQSEWTVASLFLKS